MAKERATNTATQERSEGGQSGVAPRESSMRATSGAPASPFTLMRRFMEDLDGLLGGFGFGPGLMPRIDVSPRGTERGEAMWVPPLEVFERGGQIVIRAELPGVDKDHVNVEANDGELVISGERRQEHEERRGGVYRSERVYGSFYRAIPLPEGADPARANATFRNGVLEITVPTPERPKARRIEVREGTEPTQHQGRSSTSG